MSISMQQFLSTPVHPGAYHVALTAYRAAGTPDGSGLSGDEKIKAMLAVCNAVHAMIKGPMDTAAAEAARLWDSALTGQQKRLIVATPTAAPMIVAEAIKQDPVLAQKIAAQSGALGSETAIHAGFYDVRGNSPLGRLGAGSAAALFRRSDYGSMSAEWDPSTGGRGLTPGNFPTTPFPSAGLDLATTQHLFRLGFSTPAILHAAGLTRDLGINVKGHVTAVAELVREVRNIEPSLRTVKSLTDTVNTEEKAAREAEARGDHAASAKHRRIADEARKQRQQLAEKEHERIKRERPDRPDLVKKWDGTVKAITGQELGTDADLKAGRITQQQAEAQQNVLRAASSKRTEVVVAAKEKEIANSGGTPTSREQIRATVRAGEVQPRGVAAAQSNFADKLDGDGNASTAAAVMPAPPAPTAEPPKQMADAGEKAKGAGDEKAPGDPVQSHSGARKPAAGPAMRV